MKEDKANSGAEALGFFWLRNEKLIDEMKTINEIKDLALKIKGNMPPEWMEEFIEVEA